ncbi:MAG: arginine--tRNA ligase [Proteobacteria bacterium]|nr:arginine--tRNA ligase [Pseudomonadota bacterium]
MSTQNIYALMRQKVLKALTELQKEGVLPEGLSFDAVNAEPPRDLSHGEVATNAAMVVAKPAKKNPREVAEALVKKLSELPEVEKAEIAGPGFINLRLKTNVWQSVLKEILSLGNSFGNSEMGAGQKINVEYVSANPTGPMHIGHARGAVVGDAIAELFIKTGYDVTKEYYTNDAGAQVEKLVRSSYLRYREACGEHITIPEGFYPGEYLKPVGEGLKHKYNEELLTVPEHKWFPLVREFALDSMMTLIKNDLLDMGIEHNIFSSEQAVKDAGKIEEAFAALSQKGLVYQGILPPPKSGKAPDDYEPAELTLFKSTAFGDDSDRPLKKRSGEWTYIMPDIAYHYDKIQRGYDRLILEVGQDHVGYEKRLKSAVAALSDKKVQFDMVFHANVQFFENGVPLKMSKRAGTFLTARDVLEAVGKNVLRFIMLTRKADALLDFDLEKVKEQSKDNPVFYVQYAHARIQSVIRNAAATSLSADNVSADVIAKLTAPEELALIKVMAQFPRTVESAAQYMEPHRIPYYLQELAGAFHALWNRGKEDPTLRFIIEGNTALSQARLALLKGAAITIRAGLQVIGVEPVMEM